jgi:hypothetical protein
VLLFNPLLLSSSRSTSTLCHHMLGVGWQSYQLASCVPITLLYHSVVLNCAAPRMYYGAWNILVFFSATSSIHTLHLSANQDDSRPLSPGQPIKMIHVLSLSRSTNQDDSHPLSPNQPIWMKHTDRMCLSLNLIFSIP